MPTLPRSRSTPPTETGHLRLPGQVVHYRLYRKEGPAERRLLLLHGGGVDGEMTWGGMVPHLEHWNEILVPDLRGTGKTHFPDRREHAFEVEEVVADMQALVDHFGWQEFDLGGYSYGGLVSMVLKSTRSHIIPKTFLLEPALLGKMTASEVVASRECLTQAIRKLRHPEHLQDVDEGLEMFLEAVSPNRSRNPRVEALTRSRLAHRPTGLACAMECVSHASKRLDRDALIGAQENVSSFIGERSHPDVYNFCCRIQSGRSDWRCHVVTGTDHSLPFQKPEAIARVMNEDLAQLSGN